MANHRGWWKLKVDPEYENGAHMELTDVDREHIGDSIKRGYIEGEIVQDEEETDDTDA